MLAKNMEPGKVYEYEFQKNKCIFLVLKTCEITNGYFHIYTKFDILWLTGEFKGVVGSWKLLLEYDYENITETTNSDQQEKKM